MNEHKNIITIEDEIKEFSDKPVKSSALFKALEEKGVPDASEASVGDVLTKGEDGIGWSAPSGGGGISEKVLFDADLVANTPVPADFGIYSEGLGLVTRVYADGEELEQWEYDGSGYVAYNQNLEVMVSYESGDLMIVADSDCHVTVTLKREKIVTIYANVSGSYIYTHIATWDILMATRFRYGIYIIIRGDTNPSPYFAGPVVYEGSDGNPASPGIVSPTSAFSSSITWNYDGDTGEITGTLGGSNADV